MRGQFFTYLTLAMLCSIAVAQDPVEQPGSTRDYDIHGVMTLLSGNGSQTIMFAQENFVLQVPSKCSGTQARGISVSTQRMAAQNVIDLSQRGLYIIWGYFTSYNDCAEFAGLLLSANKESHVHLKVTTHVDQSQSVVVTKDNRSYHYNVKREYFLNPF